MTIAIGTNFGTHILLAADTRTTQYDWNGNVINYVDDSVKIQETKMGLITGAGSKPLLDSVKNRLANTEVTHTNEILRIAQEERLTYSRFCERFAPRDFDIGLESTGWIFSYTTIKNKSPKLRLGIIHPSVGDVLGLYEENYPAIIGPHEATEKQVEAIAVFLNERIRPMKEFTELQDSVQYHWNILATLLRTIQPKYPSISSYSQVGIHTIDGQMGVSPILRETESTISIKLMPY